MRLDLGCVASVFIFFVVTGGHAAEIGITGNTTGAAGGEFADYTDQVDLAPWSDSVINNGEVSLAVSQSGGNGDISIGNFKKTTYLGAKSEITFIQGTWNALATPEDAISLNAFIALKIDSSGFNSDRIVLNSVSASLWRNGSASPVTYQFAYDDEGDGYDTGDLIGTAVNTTLTGSANPFTVVGSLNTSPSVNQEVRLYYWGGSDWKGHSHLYDVTTTYAVGDSDPGYVAYTNFNFGVDANHITIEGATPNAGGVVELRLDSLDGPLIGTVDIYHTGSWTHYMEFDRVLNTAVSGSHDLYLKFVDSTNSGENLFKIRDFRFEHRDSELKFPYDGDGDEDGTPNLGEYALGMNPESRDSAPFAMIINQPKNSNGIYEVSVRLRADEAIQSKLLVSSSLTDAWDEVSLSFSNNTWQTDSADISVSEAVLDEEGLYTLRLKDRRTHDTVFVGLSVDVVEGDLHVYDPVPELAPSPYYTFAIQKVSALNSTNLAEVTNWEEPFAWFTKCIDYVDDNPTNIMKYYSKFIGSWSHTYCNIELDKHTPIVVKISRKDDCQPAPAGPILSAVPHPSRMVDSCEIINGDVYVTMSQPAFVSVDIDGQLDGRDAPRAEEDAWNDSAFPYRYESNGVHAVSIFANPFIDKPDPNAPGVITVAPGTQPPAPDGSWTTLCFEPGIHHFSMTDGVVRDWKSGDFYELESNIEIYIPGDAVIFGNFTDDNDYQLLENVRVYGHGTLYGTHMPHLDFATMIDPDFVEGSTKYARRLRMFHVTQAVNVCLEGITIADQPHHGCYIFGRNPDDEPNMVKGVKMISWRVNNDSVHVSKNGYIEDCFLRHQDDGVYVDGLGLRRCIFWCDVNGTPLRCTSITKSRGTDYPAEMQKEPLVVEEVDCIYGRGVFSVGAVIKSGGALPASAYSDGTPNTGQHVVFRHINYEDPRPRKTLVRFDATAGYTPTGDWAGTRFEHLNMLHPQINGEPSRLIGNAGTDIRNFVFDDVFIAGQKVDEDEFGDPAGFETVNVYETIYK